MDFKDYKWDTSKYIKLGEHKGTCAGRTNGYDGFTCVNCGEYYSSWKDVPKCKAKDGS